MQTEGTAPEATREALETVSFYQDDGHRLDGELYCRRGLEPRAAVVFCNGWGGTRGGLSALLSLGLAERIDCVVLDFDYSGWGTSEGPRGRLDPFREVRDVQNAVSYMLQRYPSLEGHVGLYGISFGAGIAPYAAAVDSRVSAVVATSGYASGERFLRDQRAHWQWVEFRERLERDRLNRVVTGKSEMVDPDEIMIRDPEAAAYNAMLKEQDPSRNFLLDLVSADRIIDFDVLAMAPALRGRPSLFIHAERDLLIPWQQSKEVAEAAGGRFLLIPRKGHYQLYDGEALARILDEAASLFQEALVDAPR